MTRSDVTRHGHGVARGSLPVTHGEVYAACVNRTLMRALIDLAVSIELTSDDDIEPETATTLIDELAASLEDLSEAERDELIDYIEELAAATRDRDRREVLQDLPDALALTDD
jgi:hypothetical protein